MEEHPAADQEWFATSNTLVLLETANQQELGGLLRKAKEDGVDASAFHEPDLDDELTAIALGPQARALVRRLPLAFR